MNQNHPRDFAHDLVLPTLLFIALGGMTWAVRGCSGYGAMMGCLFAGVTWGAAWWYIARVPTRRQIRRYASGWIILALTVGIGVSGNRGWMQWPSFFEGHLQTNYAAGKFVPISRAYGFLWLFIAGVPWAGLGACLLAWCGSERPLRARDWLLRLACGAGAAVLANALFDALPDVFLPLYSSLSAQYHDAAANPNLRRLINDNRAALQHLGLYLGFLAYEVGRRDWKNVTLILTVGVVNGLGWALCQNWKWAPRVWPGVNFNWWRCWESCGGISIGLAYGLAYYLVNRPRSEPGARPVPGRSTHESILPAAASGDRSRSAGIFPTRSEYPNLERFAAYLGLLLGLGFSIRSGLKGWANIYLGNEAYWSHLLWLVFGPLLVLGLAGLLLWIRLRPLPADFRADLFPHSYGMIWVVLLTQNVLAQLVTGPLNVWNEMAFKIYYLLLFAISAVIIFHFRSKNECHLQ